MNFKEWLRKEIKLYAQINSKLGLTEKGTTYFNILNEISFINSIDNLENSIRTNIKNNINKKDYQYIYKQFLICEEFIENDKIS